LRQNKGFSTKLSRISAKEKEHLDIILGINRFIWNICLEYKKEIWETYKRRNPCVENIQELKHIRNLSSSITIQKNLSKKNIKNMGGYDFLLNCPAKAVQQCIRKLEKTFINSYKKNCRHPKFKKKNSFETIYLDSHCSIKKANTKNIIIKTNGMRFIVKNPNYKDHIIFQKNTKISSIILGKKPNNQYYISVNYYYEANEIKKNEIRKNKTIGVDRGIRVTATCSNHESFNIKPMIKLNNRIKFYQKQLAKKLKGSKNRDKIKNKIAKLYRKKSNIKKDFNHKLSYYLVKNHDLIVMEDLNIKNMTKSAKGTFERHGSMVKQKSGLNRSILDNNWGQLKEFVKYKADWYGRYFLSIDPRNTSRKCSQCGHTEKENREGKSFSCIKCGYKQDADLNAAINILEAGLALIACGDYLVGDSMKQELEIKYSN